MPKPQGSYRPHSLPKPLASVQREIEYQNRMNVTTYEGKNY